MQIGSRLYRLTLASDVPSDGTLLELDEVTRGVAETVADVFYSDADGSMAVSLYRRGVPVAAVEHLIAQARLRLPPAVAVVVEPDAGDRLAAMAAEMPVWVADTPPNRAAAERLWRAPDLGPDRVTTFRVDPGATRAAWCAGALGAILEHHGGAGSHPRAGALVVVGAGPEPELVAALAARGFPRVVATPGGLRATAA